MDRERRCQILLADDDEDDFLLIQEALNGEGLKALHWVKDGEELMDYLRSSPVPDFILLDLNMPKRDGREVLREIKQHPEFRKIPVIVLTTSNAEQDMHLCYQLGANCFVTKPFGFIEFVNTVKKIVRYWSGGI